MQVLTSKKFEKDLSRIKKRGKNLEKLEVIVEKLRLNIAVDPKHRPHLLKGNWQGFLELHIEPDWLLIYEINETILFLARTGTHSDLF